MLKILQVPNPILRQKSKPIDNIDKKVIGFIQNLQDTLVHQNQPKGVGLSAIQVGQPWRIFCTYLPRPKPVIKIFINPQITAKSKVLTLGPHKPILEGCLSIPRIYGPVYRHEWVKLKFSIFPPAKAWYWRAGNFQFSIEEKVQTFSGFPARVVQHEMDHLNGILFTDHSLKQNQPLYYEVNPPPLAQVKQRQHRLQPFPPLHPQLT